MGLKWSISLGRFLPYASVLLVGLSILHPGKVQRDVSSLRSDFEVVRSENETIRNDLLAVIQFLRDHYESPADVSGSGDAGLSSVPPEPVDLRGCSYMRVGSSDGVRCGSSYWLVGDQTPWGLLSSSFRGGFVADGRLYRCLDVPSRGELVSNEL